MSFPGYDDETALDCGCVWALGQWERCDIHPDGPEGYCDCGNVLSRHDPEFGACQVCRAQHEADDDDPMEGYNR